MYSQSLVVEQLLQVVLSVVLVKVGEEIEIVGIAEETRKCIVTGVEMFRKLFDSAQAGDNIGALLRGVDRKDIERGQVLGETRFS